MSRLAMLGGVRGSGSPGVIASTVLRHVSRVRLPTRWAPLARDCMAVGLGGSGAFSTHALRGRSVCELAALCCVVLGLRLGRCGILNFGHFMFANGDSTMGGRSESMGV